MRGEIKFVALERQYERLANIEKWENDYFHSEATDFERAYYKWLDKAFHQLGEARREKILMTVDQLLFHLNAMIQNSRYLEEERKRLIIQAKVYQSEIETIGDLKTLSIDVRRFLSQQQMAKQRLISFGQGGLAGLGGIVLLSTDLIAMFTINLRAIQLIAMSYGFETNRPFEMMTSLKLFHIATLPKHLQRGAWDELWEEIEATEYDELFYRGKEEIMDVTWFVEPIRQLLKAVIIMMLRKKLIQGIPLVGMAFGATMNYQFSRHITEVAANFYEKRALLTELQAES